MGNTLQLRERKSPSLALNPLQTKAESRRRPTGRQRRDLREEIPTTSPLDVKIPKFL